MAATTMIAKRLIVFIFGKLECQSDRDVEDVQVRAVCEAGQRRLVGYSDEVLLVDGFGPELRPELDSVAGCVAVLVLLEPVGCHSVVFVLADDVRRQIESGEREQLDLPEVKSVHQVDRHHRRDERTVVAERRQLANAKRCDDNILWFIKLL